MGTPHVASWQRQSCQVQASDCRSVAVSALCGIPAVFCAFPTALIRYISEDGNLRNEKVKLFWIFYSVGFDAANSWDAYQVSTLQGDVYCAL
jgi:hypothetical protein